MYLFNEILILEIMLTMIKTQLYAIWMVQKITITYEIYSTHKINWISMLDTASFQSHEAGQFTIDINVWKKLIKSIDNKITKFFQPCNFS